MMSIPPVTGGDEAPHSPTRTDARRRLDAGERSTASGSRRGAASAGLHSRACWTPIVLASSHRNIGRWWNHCPASQATDYANTRKGPQLIGEVGGMTNPFRHPVGEPRLAREHHPTLNGDVRQQGLDRPHMGEVLAQWVLEAMTPAPDHLGPGGLVGLPEDQSTVGLGLHHQEARRGQGQVVDLGEPPAPVGQDSDHRAPRAATA